MANVPAGYVPLGLVGFTDQGDYNAESIYMQNDLVHVSNTIWKCKVDNTTGITPAENTNWEVFIESGTDLAGIAAVDTNGVLGDPGGVVVSQALIDAIAQKVMMELVPYSKIVNNLLATDTNTALSGPMGKKLKEELDQVNSDLDRLDAIIVGSGDGFSAFQSKNNTIWYRMQLGVDGSIILYKSTNSGNTWNVAKTISNPI